MTDNPNYHNAHLLFFLSFCIIWTRLQIIAWVCLQSVFCALHPVGFSDWGGLAALICSLLVFSDLQWYSAYSVCALIENNGFQLLKTNLGKRQKKIPSSSFYCHEWLCLQDWGRSELKTGAHLPSPRSKCPFVLGKQPESEQWEINACLPHTSYLRA